MSEHAHVEDLACEEVVELLTDYLEGSLDPGAAAAVEAHLAACDPCHVYLNQMRATIAALGHVPSVTLSERARSDLLDAFRGYRRDPSV
jgi:anti-sigma factor RsiW